MTQLICGHAAPGARRAQETFAFFQIFMVLVWLPFGGRAQDTLPIDSFPHWIEYPGGIYDIGEAFEITVHLGTPQKQVFRAKSFEVELELTAKAQFPSTADIDLENSWLVGGDPATSSTNTDPTNKVVQYVCERTDGTQSGSGGLFKTTLTSNQNGLRPEEMVARLGGVVMVDNIEMKTHPAGKGQEALKTKVEVFPNPAAHSVQVRAEKEIAEKRLLQMDGSLIRTTGPSNSISVEGLKSGIYFLQIEFADGSRGVKRLMVAH